MKIKTQMSKKFTLYLTSVAAMAIAGLSPAQLQAADNISSIIFQTADGFVANWTVEGTSLKTSEYLTPNNTGDPNWKITGSGDFDGDANQDLLFQHADGTLAVWYMDKTTMRQPALLEPAQPGIDWRAAGVADFDADGNPDILFQHTDGRLAVWSMIGAKLKLAASINPAQPGVNWRVVAVADINADESPDLFFQNTTDGSLALWYMFGLTSHGAVAITYPVEAGYQVVGVRDFNRDGSPDILFQHIDGRLAVWKMMEQTKILSAEFFNPPQPGIQWHVVDVSPNLKQNVAATGIFPHAE